MTRILKVLLYDGSRVLNFDCDELADYIVNKFGIPVEKRAEFWSLYYHGDNELPVQLARIKVIDIYKKSYESIPSPIEIDYEKRRLSSAQIKTSGILYDGAELLRIYHNLLPEKEKKIDYCHIIITNELFGTYGDDNRWHARVIIFGYPILISTTGVVEAPARPREYYIKRNLGVPPDELYTEFKERFIDYGDPRLTELIKGYTAQSIFYYLTGDPFCSDKQCRLFNAHWQEELIYSQLKSQYEFCTQHQRVIEQLRDFSNATSSSSNEWRC